MNLWSRGPQQEGNESGEINLSSPEDPELPRILTAWTWEKNHSMPNTIWRQSTGNLKNCREYSGQPLNKSKIRKSVRTHRTDSWTSDIAASADNIQRATDPASGALELSEDDLAKVFRSNRSHMMKRYDPNQDLNHKLNSFRKTLVEVWTNAPPINTQGELKGREV